MEDRELVKLARELLERIEKGTGVITAEDLEVFQLLLCCLRREMGRRIPPEEEEE